MQINVDMIYPVGSIYMTMSTISPATLFGGTWSKIEGRFLIGTGGPSEQNTYAGRGTISDDLLANSSAFPLGETGGEFDHTLTVNEMPSHNHMPNNSDYGTFVHYDRDSSTAVSRHQIATGTSGWYAWCTGNTNGNGVGTTSYTSKTGSGNAHNNVPPYMAVNMWQRTA